MSAPAPPRGDFMWDEAIQMFEAALERDPNHEPARKNLQAARREKSAIKP